MDGNLREENGLTIRRVVEIVKRNFLLMLLIVAVFIGASFAYLHFKTPYYTASEVVVYEGKNTNNSNEVSNYNISYLFIETIVDFIDEGVVVDRANYYYGEYLNTKHQKDADYTVEDYIAMIRADRTNDNYGEVPYDIFGTTNIVKGNISVDANVDISQTVKYSFVVKYKDINKKAAEEKVKLIILAAELESNEKIKINNVDYYKYFDGVESHYQDYGPKATVSNISKSKTFILFAVIGVAVAALTVYLKTISDKTVKSKDELEQLVGQDVLATIEKTGDR